MLACGLGLNLTSEGVMLKLNGFPLNPIPVGRPNLGLQLTCRFEIKVPIKIAVPIKYFNFTLPN